MSRPGGFAVSVVNPPHRVAADHVWLRGVGFWEATFWVLAAVVAAGTLASTDLTVGRRVAELAVLGLLGLWYVLAGWRGFGGRGGYAVGYVLGIIAISVAGFAVYQLYGLMFFIL
jgi:hypothetical protein